MFLCMCVSFQACVYVMCVRMYVCVYVCVGVYAGVCICMCGAATATTSANAAAATHIQCRPGGSRDPFGPVSAVCAYVFVYTCMYVYRYVLACVCVFF